MANEKRLIDANALMKEHCNGCAADIQDMCKTDPVCGSMMWIVEAPTVDAVEVVHGRWEDEHGGKYANPRYRCSVCKERALYKFERDLLDNWKEVQALTDYCPNCGAKMDGGNEDVV